MIEVVFDYWIPVFGEVRVVADVTLSSQDVQFIHLTNASNGKNMIDRPMSPASRALLRHAALKCAQEIWADETHDRAAEEAGDDAREAS